MKHILISLAHPDDESFIVGGTIAKYSRAGWKVSLVVATNGGQGQKSGYEWAEQDALGQVRQQETNKAANILGINHVDFLGYPDSGLSNLNPGEYEDKLHSIMKERLPDIVITFDTTGFSNHPDHIKACYATTFAFQKYASHLSELAQPTSAPKGRGRVWREQELIRSFGEVKVDPEPKLYYSCIPESLASYMKKVGAHPEENYEKPWVGTPDESITTVIDITRSSATKKKALVCHKSQRGNVDAFIAPGEKNPLLQTEYYILRMQGIYEIFMGKSDKVASTL